MDIKDLSPQRKKELDELAKTRAQFVPELFTEAAISIHSSLIDRLGIEKIESPCKEIMRICDGLPPGVALACLMVALTDHWTTSREAFRASGHQ